jgi:hypothetical protein
LVDVLTVDGGHIIPAVQPEHRPDVHKMGAFIVLAWTIEAFAEDARLRKQCRADILKVSLPLQELVKRSKHKYGAA